MAVFFKPRHDFDEVAGSVADIKLKLEDAIPCVAAGAGRTGQAKNVCAARNARTRPRLDGGCRDLLKRQHVKQDCEAFDFFFEKRLDRFRRYIAAGKAGAAGCYNAIDPWIADPAFDNRSDVILVVFDKVSIRNQMSGSRRKILQQITGFVIGKRSCVRHRQNCDANRHE